jgi:hypothetical protein
MLSALMASIETSRDGEICIAFDDLAYARADTVFIDRKSNEISSLIDGLYVHLGAVSADMAANLAAHDSVRLLAPHPQGHELNLIAALQSFH